MEINIDRVVEQHTTPLLRAALGLGLDPVAAEELVQATFVAFLEGKDRFEGRSKISTFLFGILYNKARELWRARDKEKSVDAIDAVFESHFDGEHHWDLASEDVMTSPERKLEIVEIQSLLGFCLDKLTAVLRMAFTLKEVEGLTTSQICEALSVSPNHLGVLLFRARNQLRECLDAKGAFTN